MCKDKETACKFFPRQERLLLKNRNQKFSRAQIVSGSFGVQHSERHFCFDRHPIVHAEVSQICGGALRRTQLLLQELRGPLGSELQHNKHFTLSRFATEAPGTFTCVFCELGQRSASDQSDQVRSVQHRCLTYTPNHLRACERTICSNLFSLFGSEKRPQALALNTERHDVVTFPKTFVQVNLP